MLETYSLRFGSEAPPGWAMQVLVDSNIPHEVVSKLKNVGSRPDVTQEELAQALQQVYVDEADGSKTLLVPHKGHISKVRLLPVFRLTNTQHIDFTRRST